MGAQSIGLALKAMISTAVNAGIARVTRSGTQTDTGLADTLPPDAVETLTFSKVDIDLDAIAALPPVPNPGIAAPVVGVLSARPMVSFGEFMPTAVIPCVDPVGDAAGRVSGSWMDRRVMVVSADESERMYLRARLALAHLVWVDEAASTTQALAALAVRPYALAFVNVDSVAIDGNVIAKHLRAGNAASALVLTSKAASNLRSFSLITRWRRWLLTRHLRRHHTAEVLAKPLEPPDVISLLSRLG